MQNERVHQIIQYIKIHPHFSSKELAIRFKHCLVSINCFANGNGRHSRLMADLILEKLYNKRFFTWGNSDLIKATESRKQYLKALKNADNNDYRALIDFANS